jgi:sugar/nucleoside kinase (ribokinase family)
VSDPVGVLVVGDANPDLLLTGDVVPRFGQSEQEVEAAFALGGSAAICAAALARLGVDVALGAAVGDDDLARVTRARLSAAGVSDAALQVVAAPTGLSVHLLEDGDRTILTQIGAIRELDVDVVLAWIRQAEGLRHVHFASLFLVTPLLERGDELLDAAHAAGATVSVDTNYDPAGDFHAPAWLLRADVLLPNATEACRLTGADDVEDAAAALGSEGATVVVKLGERGALVGGARIPAPRGGRVVDAVGAGDAFDAGFIRGRLDGCSDADAAALGCACGTLSLRAAGADGQPRLDEARALVAR